MIMAKPAHTMPRMRAEKLRGAPAGTAPVNSPPLLTPQERGQHAAGRQPQPHLPRCRS